MPGFLLCKLGLSIASASEHHYEDKKKQQTQIVKVTARHLWKIFEGLDACKGNTVIFLRSAIPSSFSKVISACPFWSS